MNEVATYTGSIACTMRSGSNQVREVMVGETMTVGTVGQITCDGGAVDGNRVSFHTPGRYRVRWSGGAFDCLAYEAGALDIVPRVQSSGASGIERDADSRRIVLRSLATHSSWDGRADSARQYRLTDFGA
jgi:hypothetical protein